MTEGGERHGTGASQADMREALKRVAVALKETGVPFALAGGYAVWARGGPEPDHDVDFLVSRADAPKVADLLAGSGLEVQQPPEDWLFKVYTDGAMVDLLHRAAGAPDERPVIEAATELEVLSVTMPVLAATDLVVQKLAVLDERYCDLGQVLPTLRALREQVDWDVVRRHTTGNPFAEVTLLLLERLGVIGS
jgi:hypothetical protein